MNEHGDSYSKFYSGKRGKVPHPGNYIEKWDK